MMSPMTPPRNAKPVADDASEPMSIETYRQRAVAALIPILAAEADEHTAAAIAGEMLSGYNPVTPREVQVAAQVIALGWAALTCLRAAADVANLTLEERMRLHDDALALEAMSRQFDPAKRKGGKGVATGWDDAGFRSVMKTVQEVMQRARLRLSAPAPAPIRLEGLILSSGMMTPSLLTDRQRQAAASGGRAQAALRDRRH